MYAHHFHLSTFTPKVSDLWCKGSELRFYESRSGICGFGGFKFGEDALVACEEDEAEIQISEKPRFCNTQISLSQLRFGTESKGVWNCCEYGYVHFGKEMKENQSCLSILREYG